MVSALKRELSWQDRAACNIVTADLDPSERRAFAELFSTQHGRPSARREAKAKEVCGRCPVRDTCLAFALANNSEGLWGGLSDAERERLKR